MNDRAIINNGTKYKVRNVEEIVNEAIRFFCKKSGFVKIESIKYVISTEMDDLVVISDYIQFNPERLRGLPEHINNKIDFDQNRVFKILIVATICIALPTLVAGVYGMNFGSTPDSSGPRDILCWCSS